MGRVADEGDEDFDPDQPVAKIAKVIRSHVTPNRAVCGNKRRSVRSRAQRVFAPQMRPWEQVDEDEEYGPKT